MSDLRIKRIRLRNWEKVKEAAIEFPEKGLVLVLGSNLASDGKLKSIGSGKTCLGEALGRALTGISGRHAELSHYAPDDRPPSNLLVQVDAELLGKPLLVEMGYKCPELSKTGEGLRFTYDGKVIQRGHPDQTRDELSRTLQVSKELAEWTVFLDGDKLKFNRMSQQDSVNLLMTALAQPPWTDYFERATKVLQDGRRQVAVAEQALTSAKTRLTDLTDDLEDAKQAHTLAVSDYQRQVEELDTRIAELRKASVNDKNSIAAAEEAIAKSKKQLKLLEEQNAKHNHELEIQRQTLRDRVAMLDVDWQTAVETRSLRLSFRDHKNRELSAMLKVPKDCPTCGKPWDKAHGEAEIAKAREALASAEEKLGSAQGVALGINTQRSGLQAQIKEIENQMDKEGQQGEYDTVSAVITQNDRLVRNLTATIQQRELKVASLQKGVDSSNVNKKLAVVEERERALQEGQAAIAIAAANLTAEEQLVRVLEYWHKAYGPTGIPNMILADAIAPLNRVAQRISSLMTGGTLTVSYSTQRTLVGGGTKAQLVTKVDNRIGSKRLEGNSKGEAGLSNLIIAENISEIGQVSRRVGFRWYDEITSGQDELVRRSIFSYLKDVANRMGILVFVVDHHAEAANYADYVLIAEKTHEYGTRFSWH